LPALQETRNSASQLLGLSIALDHPAFSTDAQVVCAAAQACKAWQEAVRQSSACNLVVVLSSGTPLHQLRSFASWFVDHMQLVRSLTANARDGTSPDHRTPEGLSELIDSCFHEQTATRLLEKALQFSLVPAECSSAGAAAAAATPHAADDAAGTGHKQQQVHHLLRLSSFSSDHLNSAAALSALPAQHLTKLEFHVTAETSGPGSLPDLLARLSNLQELQLASEREEQVPSSDLAVIAQLRQLTQLQLSGECWEDMQQGLQQLFAQPLPLRHLQLNSIWRGEEEQALDMSALTQLVELTTDVLHGDSVLPAQLTSLQLTQGVTYASSLQPLRGHQQLQRLDLSVYYEDAADPNLNYAWQLVQLAAGMPALQQLALQYDYADHAVESASTWQLLPLQELQVDSCPSFPPTEADMGVILDGIVAATSLTKLALDAWCVADGDEAGGGLDPGPEGIAGHPVGVCSMLAQLTGLRDLCIGEYSALVPGDALALTALTNLTRLVLDGMDSGVGSAAAVALVKSLTQLQHLNLQRCGADSSEFRVHCRQLRQLTHLRM
jgi:hypothetical protein